MAQSPGVGRLLQGKDGDMSSFSGKSTRKRVRIVSSTGPWKEYHGQECDAIFYEADDGSSVNPHIDTEQLSPPLPKWQQAKKTDLEVL